MLQLLWRPIPAPEIDLQRPTKELQQDLEAGLGDGGVIPTFTQLITDKGVLGPGELVKAKDDTGLAELLADEVAAGVVDVGVLEAKDQTHLAAEAGEQVERVVAVRGCGGGGVCGVVGA